MVTSRDGRSHPSWLVEELKSVLNLNRYEARVLMALIIEPEPQTAKQIAQSAGVPIQRVYDVLNTLRRKALIVQTTATPKTFTAKALKPLLTRLVIEERLRLDEWQRGEIRRIREEVQRRIEHLQDETSSLLQLMMVRLGVENFID